MGYRRFENTVCKIVITVIYGAVEHKFNEDIGLDLFDFR